MRRSLKAFVRSLRIGWTLWLQRVICLWFVQSLSSSTTGACAAWRFTLRYQWISALSVPRYLHKSPTAFPVGLMHLYKRGRFFASHRGEGGMGTTRSMPTKLGLRNFYWSWKGAGKSPYGPRCPCRWGGGHVDLDFQVQTPLGLHSQDALAV